MNEEYMDIQVYSGDNEEQYVKYGDLLELIERLKIRKEKQDKEIERLNNIIKEVREELNKIDSATYQGDTDKKTYYKYEQTRIQKLLEILDKGE